jgi:hypothetical protein
MVLLVRAVEGEPCADQRVGPRDDVEGVLVVALAGRAGAFDEQHRLEREHVPADQRLHHVEHPRMQHEALVDRQPPVQHVDPHDLRVAREQVVDVVEQLLHLCRGDEAADDEVALGAEADVVVDGEHRRTVGPERRVRQRPACATLVRD